MFDKIKGLVAATHSPFHVDGSLHPAAVQAQCDHMIRNDITAVFITGTTGEFSALQYDERVAMTDAWVNAARGTSLKVLVHVGSNSQPEAVQLAAHAAEVGADGIATLAPHYFKPRTEEELVDFCAPIADAASALPFYYYDIPSMTGVNLFMPRFLEIAPGCIPNLAGIKFTNSDLCQLQQCLHFDDGRFDILFGCDEALLAGWALGIRGAVGSTYNFAAPIYHNMIKAFESGDLQLAAQHQYESVRLVHLLCQTHYPVTAKAVMALLGIDCGPSRSPLSTLTDQTMQSVREQLNQIPSFARILAES